MWLVRLKERETMEDQENSSIIANLELSPVKDKRVNQIEGANESSPELPTRISGRIEGYGNFKV